MFDCIEEGASWPAVLLNCRAAFLSKDASKLLDPLAYRLLSIMPKISGFLSIERVGCASSGTLDADRGAQHHQRRHRRPHPPCRSPLHRPCPGRHPTAIAHHYDPSRHPTTAGHDRSAHHSRERTAPPRTRPGPGWGPPRPPLTALLALPRGGQPGAASPPSCHPLRGSCSVARPLTRTRPSGADLSPKTSERVRIPAAPTAGFSVGLVRTPRGPWTSMHTSG